MIMPVETDIRTKIMSAAYNLIARYGYGKTTMADLAEACGMSPGILYRYFPGKLDIAEQLALQAFNEEVAALREVSVLFAALIGSLALKEGFGWRRMAGAATVVAGVAALKL